MKKVGLIAGMVFSFFLLFPLCWRIGEQLFTRPFNQKIFDPVLLVCSDHVETLRWHEMVENRDTESKQEGCTFHVLPERQKWVKQAVEKLKSPGDSSWTIRVKQHGGNRQRIDLELVGDGVAGMIYEVQNEKITPLNSRLTGPAGMIYPLTVNLLLWCALWLTVWACSRLLARGANVQRSRHSRKVTIIGN